MWALLPLLGFGAGAAILVGVVVAKQFVYVSRPNEVLIFSGRQQQLPDGSMIGYRHTHGGWTFRIPVLETVERMDLRTIPIEIQCANAYSRGGIPLAVHAIAFVKVSSDPRRLPNAIERFLGRDPREIRQVAKETLEGHVRGVLARMTPEEVNEDRLKFAEELVEEAGEDFERLGLVLDTLKVQSVSDDVSYLDSIGRESLAVVLSSAEIAESTAKAEAEMVQAEETRKGQVANEQAETAIAKRTNELRRVKADLEAAARSEEERAEQAALAARARAEQKLQEIRAKLEHLRLSADVVLPAEAQKSAAQMKARSEAATIAADGEAMAKVLELMTETWLTAGDDARDIFLIQQLEQILTTVTERVKNLEIGEVTILDGGDGRALAGHLAALPATVGSVLREFKETTGVDVTAILSGEEVRR
jgi:flotillin